MVSKNSKIFSLILTTAVVSTFTVGMAMSIESKSDKTNIQSTPELSKLKLEGDISITKKNPKITLSLRNSDVQQVLRMFADKAGLNIVFHESVKGNVTLDLVDVPLNQAFKLVLQVSDLSYYLDGKNIIVSSAEAARKLNFAKKAMTIIPVGYVDAGLLADFLNKNIFSLNTPGLSNSDIVVTNPATNELLVFGTENDVLMAQRIVKKFDKKPLNSTFKVNHTTPKEMASMVCDALLPSTGSVTSGGGGGGGSSSSSSRRGTATGGAASTGSSSSSRSSSSSSSSSSSGGSADELVLGEGVIACTVKSNMAAGSLASLNFQNMVVSYSPQRGTIDVVGGSERQVNLIKDFIAKNDVKLPQAYVEVSIIELNESGSREFQNAWTLWTSFLNLSFDSTGLRTPPTHPMFVVGDSYQLTDPVTSKLISSGTRLHSPTDPSILTWTINYLIENSKAKTLANPKVIVTNGQESVIDLTADYVKSITTQYRDTSSSYEPQVQRTYDIEEGDGVKISIVPFISPDGYVTMNLKPEYETIAERVPSETDFEATLMQRRNLDLKNVRIKDGETLVIGGLITETESKTVVKIPVLGDIPGIGAIFRSSSNQREKVELVIMITPKIIKDNEDIVVNDQNKGNTL